MQFLAERGADGIDDRPDADDDPDEDELSESGDNFDLLPNPFAEVRAMLDLTHNPTLRRFLWVRCVEPPRPPEVIDDVEAPEAAEADLTPDQAAELICAWAQHCAREATRLHKLCLDWWLWFDLNSAAAGLAAIRHENPRPEWEPSELARRCPCCGSAGPQMLVDGQGCAEFRCVRCGLVWPRDMGEGPWGADWGQKFLRFALNQNLRPSANGGDRS